MALFAPTRTVPSSASDIVLCDSLCMCSVFRMVSYRVSSPRSTPEQPRNHVHIWYNTARTLQYECVVVPSTESDVAVPESKCRMSTVDLTTVSAIPRCCNLRPWVASMDAHPQNLCPISVERSEQTYPMTPRPQRNTAMSLRTTASYWGVCHNSLVDLRIEPDGLYLLSFHN